MAAGSLDLANWIRSARILVVDDQEPWIKMVSAVLNAWGAKAVGALSVTEAETLIEQRDIDMIISDLVMPKEDGYTLVRWVRTHHNKRIQRTPIALMTAETSVQNIQRARCCGADLVIEKPMKPDVLWLRMAAVIASRTEESRAQPPCPRTLIDPCPMLRPSAAKLPTPEKTAARA